MTQSRLLLSLMIAATVSAVACDSASAIETRYVVEGTELTTMETVDGYVGTAELKTEIDGAQVLVECASNELRESAIESKGKSKGTFKYGNCNLFSVSKGKQEAATTCEVVVSPLQFTAQLIDGPAGMIEDEFKPESGEVLDEIEIKGTSCTLTGITTIGGAYTATIGDNAEVDNTEHEIKFTATGTSGRSSESCPLAFTNTVSRVKLRTGKTWHTG